MSKPSKIKFLSITLLAASAIVFILSISTWLSTGSHTGWSKNRVEIQKIDPITEIEYTEYEEKFVMGVEYLGLGLIASATLAGVGLLVLRKSNRS